MKSTKELLESYARLVVEIGISLRNNQSLLIKASPAHYSFARLLAETAYDHGAAQVVIEIDDPQLTRKRTDVQSLKQLSLVPDFLRQIDYEMMVKDWAFIRIDNTEDRYHLKFADAEKLSTLKTAQSTSGSLYRQSRMRHEHPWCVICAPGPVWAQQLLGSSGSEDDLMAILAPILKLDHDNPVQAWRDHSDALISLAHNLDDLQIQQLHFASSRTDFTVSLREAHRWLGGGDPLPNGLWFLPNIPTEEVFTTPDYLSANGYIATTRPVAVLDSLVEDAVLEFKNGRVISCTARIGQTIMERFLQIDEGASRLGEVALVDEDSPIARSKRVFGSILYDENASCHLALGAGYSSCLAGASSLTSEDSLKQAGCNTSLVHTDFMVGSDDMDITAKTRLGTEVAIMSNGRFVF